MKPFLFLLFFLFLSHLLFAQITISNVALTLPTCNEKKDGSINLTITGGAPPYTFLWSNQQTNQNCTQLRGGNYSVTVEDKNKQVINATYNLKAPPPVQLTAIQGCHFMELGSAFNYSLDSFNLRNAIYPIVFDRFVYDRFLGKTIIDTLTKMITKVEDTDNEIRVCCYWYTSSSFYHNTDSTKIRVTDARGCSFQKTLAMEANYVEPYLNLEPDTILLSSDQNVFPFIYAKAYRPLDSLISHQWYKDQKPYNGAASDTLTITEPWTKVYTLQAKDKYGCLVADSVYVIYKDEKFAYAPNVFSPNDDTHNDLFYLQCTPTVERIDLFQIYDRWGNLIYEQKNAIPNDSTFGWDGSYKGKPALKDSYVFLAQLKLRDGRKKTLSGDVLLIK